MNFINNHTDFSKKIDPNSIRINFQGSYNRVYIENPITINQLQITVYGDHNLLQIRSGCVINNVYFILKDGANIEVEQNCQFNGPVTIMSHEGTSIKIGSRCLFGHGSKVTASDMHPIYDDLTDERINKAKDISIGNSVWVGLDALVLKGANIADGAIIGARTIVTSFVPAKVVWAGSPPRILHENVRWDFLINS
jgi:acetyltransferase-like isoleucine patch superfamily enzyme